MALFVAAFLIMSYLGPVPTNPQRLLLATAPQSQLFGLLSAVVLFAAER